VTRVRAKPKIGPSKGVDLEFTGDPSLKDSFVTVIAGPSGLRQITFHRPVGITDLTADSWVATPTVEIQDLLARRVDPQASEIDQRRREHRLGQAIIKGLLAHGNDGSVRYPGGGPIRADALSAARKAAKDAAKAANTKVAADAYLNHLPQEVRIQETHLAAFLGSKEVKDASVAANPDSAFRTRSGPLADRVQRTVPYLDGKARAEAEDLVVRRLFA